MWKLYAGMHKGVAICTTPERLRDAVVPFRLRPDYGIEVLNAGNVQYVDLLEVRMNVGMLERFFCKHMAFSWECEFRMAISLHIAEEYGVRLSLQRRLKPLQNKLPTMGWSGRLSRPACWEVHGTHDDG
jgi:hypothetical protein